MAPDIPAAIVTATVDRQAGERRPRLPDRRAEGVEHGDPPIRHKADGGFPLLDRGDPGQRPVCRLLHRSGYASQRAANAGMGGHRPPGGGEPPNSRLAYADAPLIPLRVGSDGLNACLQRTLCLPLNPLQNSRRFLLPPTNRMVQVCKTLNAPISKSRKKSPQVQVVPGENSSADFSKYYHPFGTARGKMVGLGGLGPPDQAQPCTRPDRLPHRDRCPSLPAWCCGSSADGYTWLRPCRGSR